jgi:hypothetical protein
MRSTHGSVLAGSACCYVTLIYVWIACIIGTLAGEIAELAF